MKPALALIAITLLATPAIAAGNHSEHASAHQHDCPTVDNCDEDGEAKSPPSELPMVGAFPTAVNDQVDEQPNAQPDSEQPTTGNINDALAGLKHP